MQDLFEKLAALAELQKRATPGPWWWDIRPQGHSVDLYGGTTAEIVLDAKRWGFNGATIRMPDTDQGFTVSSLHEDAVPHPGRNHHKNWALTVNPARANAAFIAAAGSLDFAAVAAALAPPAPLVSPASVGGPVEPASESEWLRDGNLLYTLEHDHWRKGKSIERNRLMVRVDGFKSVSPEELEALIERLRAALTSPSGGAAPLGDAPAAAPLGDDELARINSRLADYKADDGPADKHTVIEHYLEDAPALLAERQDLLARLAAAEAKVADLLENGSPGVMHAIDKSFYELAIKERDYERRKADRLEQELATVKGGQQDA